MNDMEEQLARHRAFWARENVGQPLIGVFRHRGPTPEALWGAEEQLLKSRPLEPGDLVVDELLRRHEQAFHESGLWADDLFWHAEPFGNIPWMEAIMGCRVRWAESVWPQAVLTDWSQLPQLAAYRESPWLAKLVELTQGLVRLSAGRFPVALPLLRGPLDMAVGLRTLQRLSLDVYDHPREVEHLLELCTEANLYVADLLSRLIPGFCGGQVNYFGLWAPGWPYLHQADGMAAFSPRTYRALVRGSDQTIMGRFDHSIRKFHSASLHILDEALAMDEAVGIQVTVDPNGPPLDELSRILLKVQARKPLLINCARQENLDFLATSLSPTGLCLFLSTPPPQ